MDYTKGPWIKEGTFIYALGEVRDRIGRIQSANRFECNVTSGNRIASEEELEANARLMAASPDMYEALKTAERYLQEIAKGHHGVMLTFIRKALAKAEGRTN